MTKTEAKTPKAKAKTEAKPKVDNSAKKAAKREEIKNKILKFMGDSLQTEDLEDVPKQDVAEACGFAAPGSHGFFYAWKELQEEKKVEVSSKKGCGRLTALGKDSIPEGVIVAAPKDNAGKKEYLLKQLIRKLGKKAPADKVEKIIGVLEDGKTHHLDELCEATGWKGLSTHAFGYTMSALKKQKLVDCKGKEYTLTDKWYPDGRPE